jgi:hypothetical protein
MTGSNVTIANGANDSSVFTAWGNRLVGFRTPNSWTTSDLTLLAADTQDGTFLPVYKSDGNLFTITGAAANRIIALNVNEMLTLPMYLKIHSVTAQGGDRILGTLVV